MHLRSTAVFLLAACLSACATSRTVQMSQDTVDRFGRRELQGSRADVFRATLEGLRLIGYGVAQSDAAQGQIRTDRHLFRTEDTPDYSARAWGTPVFGKGAPSHLEREYWISLDEPSPGRVEVTASPYLYRNGQNVSAEQVWDLETERRSWERLFQAIEYQLRQLPSGSSLRPRYRGTPPPPGRPLPPPAPQGDMPPADAPTAPTPPPPGMNEPSTPGDQPSAPDAQQPAPFTPEPIPPGPTTTPGDATPPPPQSQTSPSSNPPSAEPGGEYENPFQAQPR